MPDEIVIKIKRRRRRKKIQQSAVSSSRSGLLQPRTDSDYQARRLSKPTTVNLWDLGQIIAGGVKSDLPFRINTDFDLAAGSIVLPTEAQMNALNDYLFGTPFDDWKTHFRRIDNAQSNLYNYRLFVNNDFAHPIFLNDENENWTENGLKVNGSVTQLGIGSNNVSETFITGAGINKITEIFDYDAPGVELNLKGRIDVFLLPQLNGHRIQILKDGQEDELNGGFRPTPREDYILQGSPDLTGTAESVNYWIDYFKALPGATYARQDDPDEDFQLYPVEDFPAWTDVPTSGAVNIDFRVTPTDDANYYAGKLLAIIENDAKILYVWATTEYFAEDY